MLNVSLTAKVLGWGELSTSMAQGRFQGGSNRRAKAHTRPALPKIPSASSAFPLLGVPQAPGNKPNPHKGVKSWGWMPPWGWRKWWVNEPALGQIRAQVKHGRPTLGRTRYLSSVPPPEKYGTKPFLRWVQSQSRSPHASSITKNTFGSVGIPLIRGASGARQ